MEVRLNGETHFHFGMKEYMINKLPMLLLEVCIFLVMEAMFYMLYLKRGFDIQEYNIFIWSLRRYWILIVVFTILIFLSKINRYKKELLIISKEPFIKYDREKMHSTGKDWNSYTWISNEYFYAKNIKGFYEGIFSFVIYGDVEFVKTQRDGSIKKLHKEKLVIKKIFENNAEIRNCLNEITNIE